MCKYERESIYTVIQKILKLKNINDNKSIQTKEISK